MKLGYLIVIALLLSTTDILADDKTHEFMLKNGMKVIVKEDHRAPVAVTQVWYKVGGSYEYDGITGVSHVLEHMMFKGTEKVGPGEFSRIISSLGGEENAFTGRDYTAYFETLSKDRLAKAFQLEADRMRNLKLTKKEFVKELDVVKEERRLRTEDKPTSFTYEQFNAVAWRSSPYRNPIIGWMNDLDHMKVEDLQAWYDRFYVPNNAILVVVGDVQPGEIRKLAEKTFGKLKPGNPLAIKPPQEPKQRGLTRVDVKVPARQPYLLMGYKTPILGQADEEWEPYALSMLAAILDGGSSARLDKELVRKKKIAASAGADYDIYSRLQDMFFFDGTPTDMHTVSDLEREFRDMIERVKREPVTETELKRVVAQLVSQKVFEQDSIFYQAMQIGLLETIGLDWRKADEEIERLRAVTPQQIQQVARKYLTDDNLTIAVLHPLPMTEKKTRKSKLGGGRHGV